MYGTVKIFINLDNWAESREVSCGISWNVRDTSPYSWIQQFGGVFFFTESGSLIEEIERTWKKINAMIYQLLPLPKHQSISMKTKSQLINSILILILWCQSHHWLLPKFTKRKGQVCNTASIRKLNHNHPVGTSACKPLRYQSPLKIM